MAGERDDSNQVEVTEGMIEAGLDALQDHEPSAWRSHIERGMVVDIYRAMSASQAEDCEARPPAT